jgi:hypothetical protein
MRVVFLAPLNGIGIALSAYLMAKLFQRPRF